MSIGILMPNPNPPRNPFPALMGTPASLGTNSSTTTAVPLPSGIVAGERLLLFVSFLSSSLATPAGWTKLIDQYHTGGHVIVFTKVADGSEGASVNLNYAGTGGKFSVALRFRNVASVEASGSNNNDPPALTPTWGTKSTTWLTMSGGSGGGNVTVYPSTYTDHRLSSSGLNSFVGGFAMHDLKAASDDPSSFSFTSTNLISSVTVALQPN